VRSLDKEPMVRRRISANIDPAARLSFIVADLTSDAGWDAAVAGRSYAQRLIHASDGVMSKSLLG
jgi:dihydroflavonol-4-reductase